MQSFAVLKTADNRVAEALTYAGGSRKKIVAINYAGIVIRRDDEQILFDTGLGENVDAQYCCDMPKWKRPLLKYGAVDSAFAQLTRDGRPNVGRILLSHSHWDHASGLADFPGADVVLSEAERAYIDDLPKSPLERGATMPSQVHAPGIRWKPFAFEAKPFEGFDGSFDLFGDGTAVLVPMPGHTPGSTGLFLTVTSGRRFLFCGDAVWNASAIPHAKPKMLVGSLIADNDRAKTLATIRKLRDVALADPNLTIVPAHDGTVHDRLGYFPSFIE